LEREQKRGRKVEREKGKQWGTSFKIKQWRDTETNNATTTSVADEAENAFSAGNNRACSNGESGKNEYGNRKTLIARSRVPLKKLICHRCR